MRFLPKLLVAALAVLLLQGAARAASLDFCVIQPGQPGTQKDGQPVMDQLAAYVQKKLGPEARVSGRYFNELAPAVGFMERSPARWGIVSLGFFLEYAKRFPMTPLAATLPNGAKKDVWRLMLPKKATADLKELSREVRGTMLFVPKPVLCLLFADQPKPLPFALHGTLQPRNSLREAGLDKIGGVILDRPQFEAMQHLPMFAEFKVALASKELPTSPVVWFGPPDGGSRRLAEVLHAMAADPEAAPLLKVLQTQGFGPADPDLARLAQSCGQ
jgi:hypothetical protein